MPAGTSVGRHMTMSAYGNALSGQGKPSIEHHFNQAVLRKTLNPVGNQQWNISPEQFQTWGTNQNPTMHLSQPWQQQRSDPHALMMMNQLNQGVMNSPQQRMLTGSVGANQKASRRGNMKMANVQPSQIGDEEFLPLGEGATGASYRLNPQSTSADSIQELMAPVEPGDRNAVFSNLSMAPPIGTCGDTYNYNPQNGDKVRQGGISTYRPMANPIVPGKKYIERRFKPYANYPTRQAGLDPTAYSVDPVNRPAPPMDVGYTDYNAFTTYDPSNP